MTRRSLTVVAVLTVLAAGCNAHGRATVTQVAAPRPIATTAAPSPSPTKAKPPPVDPLTGLTPRRTPVVVIKVDNATTARQYQRGLGHAAIVYQELVESGQTRFAAVYDNGYTGEVGPIRSVRETDIALLAQYGRVPVGFSGGNTGVKATFHKAVSAGKLLDASYDVVPGRYRLGERRVDARNFFATPAGLAAARKGALAKNIGLAFGSLADGVGTPVTGATMRFSDIMVVRVRYNASTGRWAVFQDGRQMSGVAPVNVVVQSVAIRHSKYVDVLGAPTPYTVTTGRGAAVVLRDGKVIKGSWTRNGTKGGTHYRDSHGHDIPLKAGSTWVLLLPSNRSAVLS